MNYSHITKHMARTLMFALLLLSVVGVAAAQIIVTTYEHDAQLTPPLQETRVCGCGESTDYFILENWGDFPAVFNLQLETNAPWVELGLDRVYLQAGEERAIPVQLNPACGVEQDAYYVVYASSEYGRYRAADRTVSAQTCDVIGLQLIQHDRIVGPCQEAQMELVVTNTATYTENYNVAVNDPHVLISENAFSLEAGEQRTVYATAQYACSVWGDRDIAFAVDADRTDSTRVRDATLTILWDYDFDIQTQPRADVCAEVTTEQQVVIQNTGSVENTYHLRVAEGANIASLEQSYLRLAPGQRQAVSLFVNPDEAHVGDNMVTIAVESEVGPQLKTQTVLVRVSDCYEHQVIITPHELTACAGNTDVNLQVQNRGMHTETFTISTAGDLYAQPDITYMELRAGEHENTRLEIGIPDRDETYNIQARVTQSPGITSETDLTVNAVSNYQCTLVAVDSTQMRVWSDQRVIPVLISNEGIEASAYELQLDGKAFRIDVDSVFLAPGEQAVVHLIMKDDAREGSYVEHFRLTSDRSDYRHDFHITVEDKGFFRMAYERVAFGENGGLDLCLFIMFILLVLLALFILFWILVHLGLIPFQNAWIGDVKMVSIIFAVLAGVFLLFAIIAASTTSIEYRVVDEPQGTNIDALFYEFPSNTVYELDLGEYFQDPDGDTLSYSVNQPGNMDVIFKNQTAVIKPARNWAGEHELVFTATDAEGLTADSPIMTVRVLRTAPVTFWQGVATYCHAINWFLLALIFALLLIFVNTLSSEKKREENRGHVLALVPETMRPTEVEPARRGRKTNVSGDVVAGNKVTNVFVGKKNSSVYVASKGGKKVHQSDCIIAQRIPKAKRIIVKNEEEAVREGYSGCRVCVPFER